MKPTDDERARKKMDAILHNLLDAFEEVEKLSNSVTDAKGKKSVGIVSIGLQLALTRLVPMGQHTDLRWQRVKPKFKI
jgi:hypothetical protein